MKKLSTRKKLILLLAAIPLVIGAVISTIAYKYIKENKINDIETILYLEQERLATSIFKNLQQAVKSSHSDNKKVHLQYFFSEKENRLIRNKGSGVKEISLDELNLSSKEEVDNLSKWPLSIIRVENKIYASLEKGSFLWDFIDITNHPIRFPITDLDNSLFYLMNRNSHLIAANKDIDFPESRLLVQEFVKNLLSESQQRIIIDDEVYLGVHRVIPDSNLILFAEFAVEDVYSDLWNLYLKFIMTTLIATLATAFLLIVWLPKSN